MADGQTCKGMSGHRQLEGLFFETTDLPSVVFYIPLFFLASTCVIMHKMITNVGPNTLRSIVLRKTASRAGNDMQEHSCALQFSLLPLSECSSELP